MEETAVRERRYPSKADVRQLRQMSTEFTQVRKEFGRTVDEHFAGNLAEWLSQIQEVQIQTEDVVDALRDGVILCTLLTKLPESGVKVGDFHANPTNELRRRENLAVFREAGLQKLGFPSCFKVEEFNDRNPAVIAGLLFLAKAMSKYPEYASKMPGDLKDHVHAMIELDEAEDLLNVEELENQEEPENEVNNLDIESQTAGENEDAVRELSCCEKVTKAITGN